VRVRSRGIAAAVVVFALGSLTAGCGADFTAGTNKIRPDNPEAQLGQIKIRNALIVAGDNQDQATLSMAVVNDGDQKETLSGVTVGDVSATITAGAASPSGSPIPGGVGPGETASPGGAGGTAGPGSAASGGTGVDIPAHGIVFVGSAGGPSITISRQAGKPALGDFAALTLAFSSAGGLHMSVPVYAASGPYATLTPSSAPTSAPAAGGATAKPGRRRAARTPATTPGATPTP
jgi:hypothetical protein